jgi:lycopene cyclase domain-containing protein
MSSWTYLWVDLGVLLIPLVASFDKRVAFVKEWKAFWPACLLTMAGFVAWDVAFTQAGIWGFNPKHLIGIDLLGLPLEEWLFFIAVPYACVFSYACLKKYVPQSPLGMSHGVVTSVMLALTIGLALTFWERAYLGLTSALCAGWLGYAAWRWKTYMSHFWVAFALLLVPFILSNGILTGISFWEYPVLHHNPSAIEDHIVWYNNLHNSGWRIFSMPVDDLLYGLLLIGINVSLFEGFKSSFQGSATTSA